ncbi:alpha/beta-hydrolase [Periconia macrospinosa]|uniref:Alpha/beta-hydrolase n=1 Tax=Periconia macrospinosa TaxID=97972 RepID=A0A2V1DP68_9PLEO|nr:alpha/beta-hydrolase [Periconia macrospinosa]
MGAAINETFEQLAEHNKFLSYKSAGGPNSILPSFDPSHRVLTEDSMVLEYNHDIPVRDGIKLRACGVSHNAIGQAGPFDQAQIPPFKEFDPGYDGVHQYKFCVFQGSDPAFWTKHGFIYVAVDARGSFASEGAKASFLTPVDTLDADDVIEYVETRPWSNGHVGMIGASALGAIQWLAAFLAPPHLSAIVIQDAGTDQYRDMAYKGGVPHLNFVEGLRNIYKTHGNREGCPLGDLPLASQQHPTFDQYWERLTPKVTNIP